MHFTIGSVLHNIEHSLVISKHIHDASPILSLSIDSSRVCLFQPELKTELSIESIPVVYI